MNVEVGRRLKEIRKHLNMSQKDFANKYGMSQQILSKYENGKSDISDRIKTSLADEFNININWLLTGKGTMILEEEATGKFAVPSEIEQKLSYEEILPILIEIGNLNKYQKECLIDCLKEIRQKKEIK